jgi:hypothetical protein
MIVLLVAPGAASIIAGLRAAALIQALTTGTHVA